MTLSTDIFITSPVPAREVFDYCRMLIGATDDYTWERRESYDSGLMYAMDPGQGLPAWLMLHFKPESPVQEEPEPHGEWCDPDCDYQHRPAHWIRVDFDTAYGYRDSNGGTCGDLHARLVSELGHWLDAKGATWKWRNEFTGEIFDGLVGLDGLGDGGRAATDWFVGQVMPAIAAGVIE